MIEGILMRKKMIKNILIIIGALLLLGFIFANIDYSRTKKGKPPILAIHVGKDKGTNADIYYGLGYIVIKCPKYENNVIKYQNKYELYFLDNRHVCVYSYNVEAAPIEEVDK
jgi:uncharacterized membrane protein YobD (UPF0266 family)